MTALWHSAPALLVLTGFFLGLSLPFGKLAVAAGVSPAAWAFLISLGGGGVLALALLATRREFALDLHRLRYFAVTALVSYAIPNLLLFSVIPKLGAGFSGILYTLSPIVTLLLSLLFRLRRPNALGLAGLAIGFGGALLVALTRGEAARPAEPFWLLLGLLLPVSLALGNVYRTLDWPKDAGPIELAAGSNLMAALLLALVMLAGTGGLPLGALADVPGLSLAQVLASAAMFALFFRLQAVGGPVFLSQIGYVAAAVGLFAGTVFFGERYGLFTWTGAALIVAGVMLTSRAQRRG
jgi:drug/metabolite transporter (DMT)-like permease